MSLKREEKPRVLDRRTGEWWVNFLLKDEVRSGYI
jgi:hypothetical protein